jgi:hypothetical protein
MEQAEDLPEGQLQPLAQSVHTGRAGRPRITANGSTFDQAFSTMNNSNTKVAALMGCSPRTVRRRAIERGLVKPGEPVYTEVQEGDQVVRTYRRKGLKPSTLPTDEALDAVTSEFVALYPKSGRSVMEGHFRSLGHIVTRARLWESYRRVTGFTSAFQRRPISRRVYSVKAPNSLWHHDGYHSA